MEEDLADLQKLSIHLSMLVDSYDLIKHVLCGYHKETYFDFITTICA